MLGTLVQMLHLYLENTGVQSTVVYGSIFTST